MTMTCHVLHAGDGYTYLTQQVAKDDIDPSASDPLVAYYQAEGNRPGQWVGAGCADLSVSGVVTEEQMLALFGEGLRPDATEFIAARMAQGMNYREAHDAARLGRRYYQFDGGTKLSTVLTAAYATFERKHLRRANVEERRRIKEAVASGLLATAHPDRAPPPPAEVRRYITDELGRARQPVAGFDLVFSPVKSVSLLWALGGHEIRRTVEGIHERAWRAALEYGEREAAYTRVGANGIAFVPAAGFVATAFQQRDSRAGDPDLHTHVAVSNRVLAADGRWRTIDSKQLHKIAVSMSETYNSLIEQGVTEQLGAQFTETSSAPGKRPVREVEGIPQQWLTAFSRRRSQVEAGYAELVRDYVRHHRRTPPRSVQMQLAQQAALQNRPAKTELRTLADQVAEWTHRARDLVPHAEPGAVIAACLNRDSDAEPACDLIAVAANVVELVARDRATWTIYHVRAEAQRQLRAMGFPGAQERMTAVESVTLLALQRHSVLLDIDTHPTPQLLQRPDGDSVFHRRGAQRYTSEAVLAAEQRLVDAAFAAEGPVVAAPVREMAIRRFENRAGVRLNPGQRALVEHFVTSGSALAVAIGPPGTGKSTAMRAVREAWETTGGRVIGLAPSAAAASVLADELGTRADTLHSLTFALQNGDDVDVQPGDMLLIDEAGMADTRTLDTIRALATDRGAVMRLVGDYRQLSAIEAGGVLRLLHHDAGGVELSEVHRFALLAETEAILRFRVGDPRAIDFYATHRRITGGPQAIVLDCLYRDWHGDVAAGRTTIMISDSVDVARELSTRAQLDRRAAGTAEADGVRLHDDTVAGVGDRIVTRKNRRRLPVLGGRDFVKNGDLWEVERRHPDGRLDVRHVRHGGAVTLPDWYVAKYVELGYAATIHRSQGLTVDISRSFLTPNAVREAALVALSRGIHGNYAYLDTQQLLNPDEPHTLPGDLYYRHRETTAAKLALRAILHREGAEPTATETLRHSLNDQDHLAVIVPQYTHALDLHRGPEADLLAEQWVRVSLPEHATDILNDDAWPELRRILHEVNTRADPALILRNAADERRLTDDPIDPAQSVAKVLHYRVTAHLPQLQDAPNQPELLPGWITPPPEPSPQPTGDLARDELTTWLHDQAERIARRVYELGERAATTRPGWTTGLGNVPSDPIGRDNWIRRAGHVAAYRERWNIDDSIGALLPQGTGDQARAREWVTLYLAGDVPDPDCDVLQKSPQVEQAMRRLRSRISNLDYLLAAKTRAPVIESTMEPEPDDCRMEPDDDPLLGST